MMAQLLYTKKYPAYRNGDRTEKKIFAFGDQEGIRVRAVRKYQNDDDDTRFKTVEITAANYKHLIKTMNYYHDEGCKLLESLAESEKKHFIKDQMIENLRERIAIFEETW
ncbi:MAG TPA: hypothetical protein VIF37_19285 [Methylobacter sp.]|jgi:ribosome recycling factor